MIRRWRGRVGAAERARFGTGLFGQVRRLLAHEPLPWPLARERAFFDFLWSILPRRIALVAVASLGAFFVATVGVGLGLTILVLHAV